MDYKELLKNARECAHNALVLIEAVEKLQDPHCARPVLSRAVAELHVGSEEARRALDSLPKN